jgi:hypothetical protein
MAAAPTAAAVHRFELGDTSFAQADQAGHFRSGQYLGVEGGAQRVGSRLAGELLETSGGRQLGSEASSEFVVFVVHGPPYRHDALPIKKNFAI